MNLKEPDNLRFELNCLTGDNVTFKIQAVLYFQVRWALFKNIYRNNVTNNLVSWETKDTQKLN